MLMLRLVTVIVSVPNAVPETVKVWFCSKIASHSARANQLSAKAHSRPRPTVAPLPLVEILEGARPLDVAPAGEQGRGTRHCRARKRLNDRAHTQKNCLKPHRRQCWVIPPKANSAFVAAMEDVLAVYTRPHNPDYPLVCLDETSKQLIAETRTPIPMKRGREDVQPASTTSTSVTAPPTCSCCSRRSKAGATSR